MTTLPIEAAARTAVNRAWCARVVASLTVDLRAAVGIDPAPVIPASPRVYSLREHQAAAVAKVGVIGPGAVIFGGICANA